MQKATVTPITGGLDLVSPPISVAPERCIAVRNYEVTDQGVARCQGYERFDGQTAPSAATYAVLNFDGGSGAISAGDTVTGATSGATGVALYDASVSSGSWAGGDAAGFLVLYKVSGTFQDNENLQVASVTKAVANGTQISEGATDDTTHNSYMDDVRTALRALIGAVPGSGGIRGVHVFNGDVYAFRDDAGGAQCVMHKATSSGWVAQSFGRVLYFDAGSAAFSEGETVTGGTSGATATVERVVQQSGTWGGLDAAGYLVLSGVSGAFQDNEALSGGSGGAATANGVDAAITLAAGGRVRCVNHNFYGTSNLQRMYGVTSTGRAFEWDGTVLAPIDTGLSAALDKPKFIGVHANHLLLGYDGGAVQFSGTGLPLSFMAVDGAGEFGIGQDVTGILSAAATATVVFAENRIGYLTGTSSTDFRFDIISQESGAKTDSAVMANEPIFMDNQGVRRLSTSQAFGDWKMGSLSRLVQPYIENRRRTGKTVVGAHAVHAKDQYRLTWDDGHVLVVYLGGKQPEITVFEYGFTPTCAAQGEDATGAGRLFYGTSDGYVIEADKGVSFDGSAIEAYIRSPWRHQGAPDVTKRYHGLNISMDGGETGATISVAVEYSYADDEVYPKAAESATAPGRGGFWETAVWDEFYWDTSMQSPVRVDLDGIGDNLSYVVMSNSDSEEPHILSSDTVWFTPRRTNRRKAL
ncbi:MAG: hypothetical protein D6811_04305 [Alphaproteobacteria bacterium]|nr:MAG: hypothetical protein D6811_04305 [Alphaproteobacteria bacterium]